MLSVRNLHWLDRRLDALDLAAGECIAVTGPSGAGKSRLLRAIADLDPADGTVALDGRPREAVPAPDWRRQVMYLAATPGWWADTVGPHLVDDRPAADPHHPDNLNDLLEAVGLPAEAVDWTVQRLSSGEQQRIALVRALRRRPRVLLLDEPTASLDSDAAALVERLLQSRLDAGMGALLVTHDPAQAARLTERAVRLDGPVAQVSPL